MDKDAMSMKRKKRVVVFRRVFAVLVALSLTLGLYYSRYSSPFIVEAAQEIYLFGGNAQWTAPPGVTSVLVDAAGGGGGGGGTNASGNGGGGGAGGGYAQKTVTVTPGNNYVVVVGRGGAGGTGTANGSNGGDSMFSASSTLLAVGGPGGASLANGSGGGATTTGSTAAGDVIHHGGNGGNGTGSSGGGGGGGSFDENGVKATGSTGGAGGQPSGGSGGNGVSGNNNGNFGSDWSGGGSGADSNNSVNRTGGVGGEGFVQITYTVYTILGNGVDPGNTTLSPGDPATNAGAFTLQTSTTTDTVTAAVVDLGSGAHNGISLVEITNNAGTTVYGSVSNPSSATPSITLNTNTLTATTTASQYMIRITPKSVVTGGPYTVTAKISSYTSTNTQSGTDTAGTTITINNTAVPGAPGTPTFSNITTSGATVSWPAASGADTYKLERCMGSGCTDYAEIATGIASATYDDSGLSASTIYRYRVRGTNAGGDGSYSGTGDLTTSDPPSSSPSYIRLKGGTRFQGGVRLR